MNTQEKLERIKARCLELLAIAEKRERGPWMWDGDPSNTSNDYRDAAAPWLVAGDMHTGPAIISGDVVCRAPNAAYIASCAGPAEAGWRATIAAIDIRHALDAIHYRWDGDCGARSVKNDLIDSILAAWPDEIL